MGRYWNYQRAQLKRTGKVFPTILFMTLLLLIGIALLGFIFLKMNQRNSDEPKKYQIGVVGDTSDPYLSMGIAAVQEVDSSRFMIDFLIMEEEQAIQMIKKGELSAYLVIPEGFVDSVMVGENKKITFVSSEGTVDISTILLNEVVGIISEMITDSQAAGSGLYRVMKDNDIEEEYNYYADKQDIKTAMMILTRSDIYEMETYRGAENISLISYYVCGILLFFLLIWGINASSILAEKNQSMQKLLKSRGQKIFSQIMAEYAAYECLMLMSMLIIFVIAYVGMKMSGKTLAEWEYATPEIIFRFFGQLIPVFLFVASLQFFLYECTKDVISGILLQFLAALSLAYISGCFYPLSFFPDLIVRIDKVLPTGIAMSYMCDCIMEEAPTADGLKLVGYTLGLIIISSIIRNARLNNVNNNHHA